MTRSKSLILVKLIPEPDSSYPSPALWTQNHWICCQSKWKSFYVLEDSLGLVIGQFLLRKYRSHFLYWNCSFFEVVNESYVSSIHCHIKLFLCKVYKRKLFANVIIKKHVHWSYSATVQQQSLSQLVCEKIVDMFS